MEAISEEVEKMMQKHRLEERFYHIQSRIEFADGTRRIKLQKEGREFIREGFIELQQMNLEKKLINVNHTDDIQKHNLSNAKGSLRGTANLTTMINNMSSLNGNTPDSSHTFKVFSVLRIISCTKVLKDGATVCYVLNDDSNEDMYILSIPKPEDAGTTWAKFNGSWSGPLES
eukprot:Pgem_evm2s1170